MKLESNNIRRNKKDPTLIGRLGSASVITKKTNSNNKHKCRRKGSIRLEPKRKHNHLSFLQIDNKLV